MQINGRFLCDACSKRAIEFNGTVPEIATRKKVVCAICLSETDDLYEIDGMLVCKPCIRSGAWLLNKTS
jgi:hypothetical protein